MKEWKTAICVKWMELDSYCCVFLRGKEENGDFSFEMKYFGGEGSAH